MKTSYKKCCLTVCSAGSVVISIIIGAVAGILFALGYIPLILTGVWAALALAVLVLIVILTAALLNISGIDALSKPIHKNLSCLLIGSIGTILASLISVSVVLDISIAAIVALISLGGFFFTLMILGLISFIKCIVYCV